MSIIFQNIPKEVQALIIAELGGVTDISKTSLVCKSWALVVRGVIDRIGKELSLSPLKPCRLVTTRQVITYIQHLREGIVQLVPQPPKNIQTLLEKKGALIPKEIKELEEARFDANHVDVYINTIKRIFVLADDLPLDFDGAITLPSDGSVKEALKMFTRILSPDAKMMVFACILNAVNSTDDTAREFYNALPTDMQEQFRHHIWLANRKSDDGHGIAYGDYMIAHAIRTPICRQAALNCRVVYLKKLKIGS